MIFKVISFTLFAAMGGTVGFWVLDRQSPTVVIDAVPMNEPVRPGEDLRIKYRVQRFRSCETTIDRTLFDADQVRVILDDIAFNSAPGPMGESVYVATVPIPRSFATGAGRYRVATKYVCNPLQRLWPVVVENPDLYFKVEGEPLPANQMPFETVPRK